MSILVPCFLLFGMAVGSLATVLHPAPALPSGWKKLLASVAVDEDFVVLSLSLRQTGLDKLYDNVHRVSDPSSAMYGKYLTPGEVEELTAPQMSSIDAVESWLVKAGVRSSRRGELVHITLKAAIASKLLQTQFYHVANAATSQQALVAGDYYLPVEVHNAITAIYGLHGLPLPPRSSILMDGTTAQVNITPALLIKTYGVSGVKPSGSQKNRQAVAEFQDQTMGPPDLERFFHDYVPNAPPSASSIHKYVGANGTVKVRSIFGLAWGVEASLDVDYIMGPAPGVLTEFWYFNETDFCAGLKHWSSSIVSSHAPPLVHSVSWGFQGNISTLGCAQGVLQDIETDFAKLALRGITIIFASGDSGSGYVAPRQCDPDKVLQDTAVTGTVKQNFPAMEDSECCELAVDVPGLKAWSFTPPTGTGQCKQKQQGLVFQGEIQREELGDDEDACCDTATMLEGAGYTLFANGTCRIFKSITGKGELPSVVSGHVDFGVCQAFSEVTGTRALKGAVSGGDGVLPTPVRLYPQWPGSSPMVTSVGATKFANEDVTKQEVAVEQFGSGGGFSDMFPAFPAQVAAIAQYFQNAPQLPPTGSFPPAGRATPDVSALGEGYQVVANGKLQPVGGTSASAPAFAALISLLNEARINAGKPPMGYLNPWIYANPGMFTDVTRGTNAIGRDGKSLEYGFNCTAGWDPVTGLGTPIFSKMMSSAMASPGSVQVIV